MLLIQLTSLTLIQYWWNNNAEQFNFNSTEICYDGKIEDALHAVMNVMKVQVLKMSSMRFNACLNLSRHGPPHAFKDAGVVANILTGIHSAMVKCLCCQQGLPTQGFLGVPTCKNPEDSNLVNVEAMQWVYLSNSHNRCCWEHLA
jgi:hypothetical protein